MKHKPIDGLPLFNDGWVFFIYGWVIATVMARYENLGASIESIEKLAMEPFSVGTFFAIATTGFILVLSTVAFLEFKMKWTTERIREFFLLKRIFIPISEVGLSTGAIIMGMSMGIAFKFAVYAPLTEQADITKVTLKISLLILMIYLPMFWQQRSILSLGKIENLKFNLLGVGYIIVCGVLIFLASFKLFITVATFTAVLTSFAYYKMVYKKANKQILSPAKSAGCDVKPTRGFPR